MTEQQPKTETLEEWMKRTGKVPTKIDYNELNKIKATRFKNQARKDKEREEYKKLRREF